MHGDNNGNIRSFEGFSTKADKYNVNWFRTEYNQAVATAQASARWQDFTKNKDVMPYLQYQAVMDANTREEHAVLNSIIKRINDKFWDRRYMHPNCWEVSLRSHTTAGVFIP